MNDAEKKREVATFVLTEHNIKKAEVTQELLKNQFLEAVPENYYLKLNAGVLRYSGSTVYDLLTTFYPIMPSSTTTSSFPKKRNLRRHRISPAP